MGTEKEIITNTIKDENTILLRNYVNNGGDKSESIEILKGKLDDFKKEMNKNKNFPRVIKSYNSLLLAMLTNGAIIPIIGEDELFILNDDKLTIYSIRDFKGVENVKIGNETIPVIKRERSVGYSGANYIKINYDKVDYYVYDRKIINYNLDLKIRTVCKDRIEKIKISDIRIGGDYDYIINEITADNIIKILPILLKYKVNEDCRILKISCTVRHRHTPFIGRAEEYLCRNISVKLNKSFEQIIFPVVKRQIGSPEFDFKEMMLKQESSNTAELQEQTPKSSKLEMTIIDGQNVEVPKFIGDVSNTTTEETQEKNEEFTSEELKKLLSKNIKIDTVIYDVEIEGKYNRKCCIDRKFPINNKDIDKLFKEIGYIMCLYGSDDRKCTLYDVKFIKENNEDLVQVVYTLENCGA